MKKEKKEKVNLGKLGLSRHHIIPDSRGGSCGEKNITVIDQKLHNKYHALFIDMTPEEVIGYLVNVFWKGQDRFVSSYLNGWRGNL